MINQNVYLGFEEEARKLKAIVEKTIVEKLADLPLSLNMKLQYGCFLSGSAISSLYHGEEPKDYDLWCKNSRDVEEFKKLIVESYLKHVAEYTSNYTADGEPVTVVDGEKQKSYLITANAITFKNKVQLITLDDYMSCRNGFDFIHCMPYYDIEKKTLHISPRQMESIKTKTLYLNSLPNAKKPTEYRLQKFKNRGWS